MFIGAEPSSGSGQNHLLGFDTGNSGTVEVKGTFSFSLIFICQTHLHSLKTFVITSVKIANVPQLRRY